MNMKFAIFHAKKGNFLADELPIGDFKFVATVNADNINDVFGISQNIDKSWLKNQDVIATTQTEARSTSVGDVIKDIENSRFYMLEFTGMTEVHFVEGKVVRIE